MKNKTNIIIGGTVLLVISLLTIGLVRQANTIDELQETAAAAAVELDDAARVIEFLKKPVEPIAVVVKDAKPAKPGVFKRGAKAAGSGVADAGGWVKKSFVGLFD